MFYEREFRRQAARTSTLPWKIHLILKDALTAVSKIFCKHKRMKNESTNKVGFDAALAHGLARLALGLNIAMHGYSRLPNLVGFANGLVKQFAGTFLPSPLVYIMGFGIAIGEAVVGTLLVFGLLLRPTLVIGTLLMLLLIFGSTLIQQWEIVSVQMIYVAFYVGLLATVRYDRFSLDGLRQRK
jgi:thiosulfate dehydrogenase [quinone] large subunit